MATRQEGSGTHYRQNGPAPTERLNFSFRSRLPVVLQNELSECALACIAMITSYHGYRTTLTELRRRFGVALTGSTVRSIVDIANRLELSARPVRLDLDEIKQLRVPAILHWRLNHFVVLRAVRRKGIVIHDPAQGMRFVRWNDASRFFTGVAVELYPSRAFKTRPVARELRVRDLWDRSKGLGGVIAQVVLLSAILQVIALISPLINQLVVDEAIAKNDSGFLRAILIGFGLLLISQTVVEVIRSSVTVYFGLMLTFQLRSNLLRHVFGLPADFFEKRHIGDIVSRIESLTPIQQLISSAVVTVLIDGVLGITTFVVMYMYSPTLAMMVVAATAFALACRLATFPYVRRLTEEKIFADAELQTVLLESIRAIRAVKLFGRETERHVRWQNAFVDASNIGIRLQKFGITAGAASRLLLGGLDLAVFYVGAQQVISGSLTLGMFFAFQAYRLQFSSRTAALITQYFSFRTVGIHLQRLTDIVHTEPEVGTAPGNLSAARLSGKIDLNRLRFRYGDDQPWVFDGVNLSIEPRDRVALIGESGGGKSTLLKVMLGLHPLTDGSVLFDGVPLGAARLSEVRAQIGVVMQDDRLLSGTLAENICFFDDSPDMNRIVTAAGIAHIAEDIERMPMGFNTLVGDMGSTLSGGQKQRLLLARALYREPNILFLDEGTANLDAHTESKVLENLLELSITQVIVAHRPAAVSACNRIVRVGNGNVREVR